MPTITLTTDFGTSDWFVGAMKGVILEINPQASLVDITHAITPGDIRGATFALASSYCFFKKGAVHVAVVDPGVGSSRKGLAVQTERYYFVGPDNGVLSLALARERIKAIHLLETESFFHRPVSQTFHGRDIFGPVAAHLSRGLPVKRLGPATETFIKLTWPKPRVGPDTIEGEIIHVDHFGNAITNVDSSLLARFDKHPLNVFRGRRRLCTVEKFYQVVPARATVAVVGSTGFLEVAINGGNAAKALRLSVGTPISARVRQ